MALLCRHRAAECMHEGMETVLPFRNRHPLPTVEGMESYQLSALIVMQIALVPVTYVAWAFLRTTWPAIAPDRAYARSRQGHGYGALTSSRYLFVLIWVTLNFGMVNLIGSV